MRNEKYLLIGVISLCLIISVTNVSAQTDFQTFWTKFKSAVEKGDKTAVTGMTNFPVNMPAYQKNVKTKADFLRRYNQIFNGEANAAQCFAEAKPQKRDSKTYEVYCPFKQTPDDWTNAPINYYFVLTKTGWKFAGLDNINE